MCDPVQRGLKEIKIAALTHLTKAAGLDTLSLAASLGDEMTRGDMLAFLKKLNTAWLGLRELSRTAEEEVLDLLDDPDDIPF